MYGMMYGLNTYIKGIFRLMRKSDLIKKHDYYDATVERYRSFTSKVINAQRVLSGVEEKRDLVESVVLRLCANWEYFVDEYLVASVNKDHSKLSDFLGVSIPPHPSAQLCQALIFGDSYRDFPSFGSLKGFSKKLLKNDSNPFLVVKQRNWKKIDEVYAIRNYLSHYSSKARRTLFNMYKKNYDMSRFLEPGQFLLAYEAKRLWVYFDAFENASTDMKLWLEDDS